MPSRPALGRFSPPSTFPNCPARALLCSSWFPWGWQRQQSPISYSARSKIVTPSLMSYLPPLSPAGIHLPSNSSGKRAISMCWCHAPLLPVLAIGGSNQQQITQITLLPSHFGSPSLSPTQTSLLASPAGSSHCWDHHLPSTLRQSLSMVSEAIESRQTQLAAWLARQRDRQLA